MSNRDRQEAYREAENRYRRAMQGWWEQRPPIWRLGAYLRWLVSRPRWEVEE